MRLFEVDPDADIDTSRMIVSHSESPEVTSVIEAVEIQVLISFGVFVQFHTGTRTVDTHFFLVTNDVGIVSASSFASMMIERVAVIPLYIFVSPRSRVILT
jgi:hypothetical protein